jgi:hypothetical protein
MDLFTSDSFEKGGWATVLRNKHFKKTPVRDLVGWECMWKIWRGTGQRWLQYQPPNTGPFFWSGKPAIISTREALYAGYYVERGLSSDVAAQNHRPKQEVINDGWDWNRFLDLLIKQPAILYSELAKLPAERRCIWLCDQPPSHHQNVTASNLGRVYSINNVADLDAPKTRIDHEIHIDHWIDLIAGVRYAKDECLDKDRWPSIVREIVNALELTAPLVGRCSQHAP